MEIKLSDCIAPAFYKPHKLIKNEEYSSFWLKGGRGSTKSSFAAIEVILGLIEYPEANALVLRKVDATIRKSVLESLLWAINKLGLDDEFEHTVSPAEITYIATGQKIIMTGLDDARKIKSIRLKKGYFKYLWWEEFEEFANMEEVRSVRQSARRGGDVFIELITYNPPNYAAAWINKAAEEAKNDPETFIHHSTYLDVPEQWLGKQFIKDAERLAKVHPLSYQHEYLGEVVGRAEQIVFNGKFIVRDFETPNVELLENKQFYYGADWGFARDPTAITRSFIYKENGQTNLYIDYEAGGIGIDTQDLPPVFETIPDVKRYKIRADGARPETISAIGKSGFSIEAAPKWTGSEEDGIAYLRSFDNIIIHTRCKQTAKEFSLYSYKVDKMTQDILPSLIDANNHYIDSLRYAHAPLIRIRQGGFRVL